ncbi:MAG: alanine racemase [Ilumatobacteraceae bacterium]|jgi:alanine racemase|nr:alanine racemase [Ilumatobacteraceae bacterium]MDP5068112.1 alanine racemase [Ilumatobacteraceae bacterium]
MSIDFSTRWAWAEVHTGLISHNVAIVAQRTAPVQVWAVVKANGYGHGAIQVANAALAGGATGLCVAIVDEGVALRRAGITAPILLLSEQPAELADLIVGYQLTPTVTTTRGAAVLAASASAADQTVKVHIKVDTGMHRVGVAPNEVVSLASFISSYESLTIEGVYTHFAVADDPSHSANAAQLSTFNSVLDDLSSRGINPPLVHAANSAAALANEPSRFTMVRLGIAMYGLRPGPGVAELCAGLIPAMSLKARVSAVRWVEAGEAVSYGLVRPLTKGSLIATVPIGYADGVPRALGRANIQVLLNGVPRSFAGTITMDQLMIDCESDSSVMVGDEVVLIGKQGVHSVTADDWADALGTIGYEIVCGISPRIFRRYS